MYRGGSRECVERRQRLAGGILVERSTEERQAMYHSFVQRAGEVVRTERSVFRGMLR